MLSEDALAHFGLLGPQQRWGAESQEEYHPLKDRSGLKACDPQTLTTLFL